MRHRRRECCFGDLRSLGSVDDQRPFSLRNVPPIAHLPLAGTDGERFLRPLGVGVGADPLEGVDGGGGLVDGLDGVGDDEGELGDGLDAVAAGEDEGGDGGGGDGGDEGEAALVEVDAAVPAAPGLGGGEHAAAAAHVAEGPLAGAVGAAAGDAGDSGHGAAGAPGLGRGLVAGAPRHGVGLPAVLGEVGVDEAGHVGADRRPQHVREGEGDGGRQINLSKILFLLQL